MHIWLMEQEPKIQVRTCRVEENIRQKNQEFYNVKQCNSYIWNAWTLTAVSVVFVLSAVDGGISTVLCYYAPNITPARPVCTHTHPRWCVIKYMKKKTKNRRDKSQNAPNLWGTYVPYCKEDQGHTEDQRQHVAEGSKSEHNWKGKRWVISQRSTSPLTNIYNIKKRRGKEWEQEESSHGATRSRGGTGTMTSPLTMFVTNCCRKKNNKE